MREKLMSMVIILMAIFSPILILPDKYGIPYIPKLIVLLATGLMLLILILVNYKKVFFDKKDILLLIFGGLVFISTIFSSNIKKSVIGEENRYEGMLAFFTYILIFFTCKKFFKKEYIKYLYKIMYIVILAICVLSLCQHYIKTINFPTLFTKKIWAGSTGTFGNSNFLGSFVSLCLPIFTTYFIVKGKIKNLLLSNVIFSSMLVCLARSSWVACITYAIFVIFYLLYKRKKEYFIRFIIIVITFIGVFFIITSTGKKNVTRKQNVMINEIKQVTTTGITEKTGSGRIAIWKMVIKLTSRNWILGVGPDNLKEGLFYDLDIRYNELYNYFIKSGNSIDKAHNEYLQIAVTIGVPALLIYLIFLGIIFFKNLKLSIKDNARLIFLSSILAYLVQAFFNISMIGVSPLFWLMLGMICNDELMDHINTNLLKD